MEHIQPTLDYFAAHPNWALTFVFLIAFGEALLIIGLFVPSTAALIGAGVLVGTGHLGFWPVFLATTLGAIAGDQISYWAGRLYGERLKTMWPLNHYPQLVARGEDYVRLHGGKSIALGRFVPGVKAVVPGIVGMFGMGQVYFAAINFSSGTAWAAAHVFPGMLIGQGLAVAGELSGRLVVVLIVLLVIVAVAGYLIRLIAAGVSPYLSHMLGRLSVWARGRNSPSLRRFARSVSPENPRSLLVVLFAAVAVAGLIGLSGMAIRIVSNDAVSNMDISVLNLMKEMRNAPSDDIMIALTMLGDGVVMTVLAVAILVWLVGHRSYRAAMAAAISILAGVLFVPLLKFGIQRPRPEHYTGAELFSFPSGHATMAALIFGILAMLVSHSMGRWSRAVVFATCGVMVVAIAYSRVYLGVHWLSDVLGGLLFGGVMAAAFGVAIEAIPPRRIRPVGLFGTAFIAFIAGGSAHVAAGFSRAEATYAPAQAIAGISFADWERDGWRRLPARRIDLAGKPEEVFVAQLAGDLEQFARGMADAAWQVAPTWTWKESLAYLDPNAALADLPPGPALHEGLKAKLTMTRDVGTNGEPRQVLRLYKTGLQAVEGAVSKPIYLVSLRREHRRGGFRLYAVPAAASATEEDRGALRTAFAMASGMRVVAANDVGGAPQELLVTLP
jgi:undecaprenyl-diphosphatase